MWNGTTQQAMGRTSIQVYNPVTKLTYGVNFDVVLDKLTTILGCRTIQEMGLVQLNTGTYDSVSSVHPQSKSQTDYYKEFPEVFNKDVEKRGDVDDVRLKRPPGLWLSHLAVSYTVHRIM